MVLFAAAVSGGLSIFSSILNNAVNWKLQQETRNLQRDLTREANRQNESLMREAWARDDTARQRMVADLEQAGLSKWLAAGASPMSSSPISLSSPDVANNYQSNVDFGSAADKALAAYRNVQQAYQTEMQTQYIGKELELIKHQIDAAEADARQKKHDADVLDTRDGVMSNDPQYAKYASIILHILKGIKNN